MRISRMMINYLRIESICEKLEVAVKDNMKKPRLSWFKCVQCRGRHHGYKLHKELDKPKPKKWIHIPIPHMVER